MKTKFGYTLLEIIVVMIILVTLMSIGAPMYIKSKANTDLKMNAETLQADLDYMKAKEKNYDSSTSLVLRYTAPSDSSCASYSINEYDNGTNSLKSTNPSKIVVLPAGVTISINGLGSNSYFGYIKSGATRIADNATFTMSSSKTNKTFTIIIYQATGFIKMSETN
jgi:prepilin-type N-terminal cleavage/methylation domain-containing protein